MLSWKNTIHKNLRENNFSSALTFLGRFFRDIFDGFSVSVSSMLCKFCFAFRFISISIPLWCAPGEYAKFGHICCVVCVLEKRFVSGVVFFHCSTLFTWMIFEIGAFFGWVLASLWVCGVYANK